MNQVFDTDVFMYTYRITYRIVIKYNLDSVKKL